MTIHLPKFTKVKVTSNEELTLIMDGETKTSAVVEVSNNSDRALTFEVTSKGDINYEYRGIK